jgi:hypothetical protein
MFRKRAVLAVLTVVALLAVLSGCGWKTPSSPASAGNGPDRVQIAIHTVVAQAGKPVVTLTDVSLVRQLYATTLALAPLPQDVGCPSDFGPSYTLTFLRGKKTLTTATAQRYGCRRVSLSGEKQDRGGTQTFWSQLDQAIHLATPVARLEELAILRTLQPGRPAQTARIMSVETARRLYRTILALPQAPQNGNCVPTSLPTYQLVFHTADQAIPSLLDETCNTLSLQGNYRSRSGTFEITTQFKQLFQQVVSAATFAPAHPDRLTLSIQPMRGAAQDITVDAGLRQQLYTKIFALPMGKAQPDCPPVEDAVSLGGHRQIPLAPSVCQARGL